MTQFNDILDREEFRRRESQEVPTGYFESLQARLSRISSEQVSRPRVSRPAPVFYWATAVAAALVAGLLILNHGAASRNDFSVISSYDYLAEAGLASMTDIDASILAAGIGEDEISASSDGESANSEVDALFENYSQDDIARYLSENGILY